MKDKIKTKSQLMEEIKMLRQRVAALEQAVESAGLGVWDHDLVSDKVIRNKQWAEMLDYTLEELESDANTWRNLIHPDDIPVVNKIAADHEAGLTPFFQVEHRLKSKSGEWKWILNWGKVVERDKEGRPLRATGTHLDITERKQEEEKRLELEAQIQQAQKFESLNVMAGSIAHNFNNLLMVVLGNLELALDSLPLHSPERIDIQNAEKAAKHAAELSSLMLTYVGHKQMHMQEVDILEIIKEMKEILELTLSKKTVLKFNPGLEPVLFKGDNSQICQLVMNLVSNAAEAVGDN
ncbi:MAG: PAS domain-containing protein, partial [Candidatus Aminicenantes bacterium]